MPIKRHRPQTAILQRQMQMRAFVPSRHPQILRQGDMARRCSPRVNPLSPKENVLGQEGFKMGLTLAFGQRTRALGHGKTIARFGRRIGCAKQIAAGRRAPIKPDKPNQTKAINMAAVGSQ